LMNELFLITVTKFIVNYFQFSLQFLYFRFHTFTSREVFCGQTFEKKNDLQRQMDPLWNVERWRMRRILNHPTLDYR
jgi:hypothetical protein